MAAMIEDVLWVAVKTTRKRDLDDDDVMADAWCCRQGRTAN